MEYKLLECESCQNLVSVSDTKEPTFVCPICGLINDRARIKKFSGVMTVTSPRLKCVVNYEECEEGIMDIDKMSDEVKEALEILRVNGWVIRFTGEEKKL